MAKIKELLKRQEDIKRKIGNGDYKTLADIILDRVGRLVRMITRTQKTISPCFSACILGLFVGLFITGIALLLGDSVSLELFLAGIWGIALGTLLVFLTTVNGKVVYGTFSRYLVDSFLSLEELNDAESKTAAMFGVKRQMSVSLLIGIIAGLSGVLIWMLYKGEFPGISSLIGAIVVGFLGGTAVYWVIPLMILPHQLSKYNLKLYAADPSNSEVIDRISDMLNFIVFMGAIVSAFLTAGLVVLNLLNLITAIFYLTFASWGPLIILFTNNQYGVSKIIIEAKWKTLNQIQNNIVALQQKDEIPTKETLEHIGALMDYHDRIRNTRNSALDFRESLKLINSLLLPLIAFLLANLDNLLAIF